MMATTEQQQQHGDVSSTSCSRNGLFHGEYNTVLVDIEGTVTSIAFVKDVLFPYARIHLSTWLAKHWKEPTCQSIAEDLVKLATVTEGAPATSIGGDENPWTEVQTFIEWLMDRDVKATPLKALQGLIWRSGYENEEIKSHVYPDVPDGLSRWFKAGIPIYVYSSGSIDAQKLLFGYSEAGDLLPMFSGHFDTTIGAKVDTVSYVKIAAAIGRQPADILFLSDNIKEVRAATEAGMRSVVAMRSGNASLSEEEKREFPLFYSLADFA